MLGAIIGDIVGSRFEFDNYRAKDFDLFDATCTFTDDSVMSLAIAKAVQEHKHKKGELDKIATMYMQELGRKYPRCGFGGHFVDWVFSDNPRPYNSLGNGAAMRVSACAIAAKSRYKALKMSDAVTKVSHNHPEGIKGARAVTDAIWLAKKGKNKNAIKEYICRKYYNINFTINGIRPYYRFNETCQDTVPQALEAFFESESFEDALRIAISVGGDSDTLAAITCSIAQVYYGIPRDIYNTARLYLDDTLLEILDEFEREFGNYTA